MKGRETIKNRKQFKKKSARLQEDSLCRRNLFISSPQVKAIVIYPGSPQWVRAEQASDTALANYIFYRDFHGGVDVPWFDPEVVWEPADTDWPFSSVLGESL